MHTVIHPIVASISWPFVVIAAFGLVCLLTWPAYRRLVRRVNLTCAEGDDRAALQAALDLNASRLPMAWFDRVINRGRNQGVIAHRLLQLGRHEEAVHVAEAALTGSSPSQTRSLLHFCAGYACLQLGTGEEVEQHTEAIIRSARKGEGGAFVLAAQLLLDVGEPERGSALLLDRLRSGSCGRGDLMLAIKTLVALGGQAEAIEIINEALPPITPPPTEIPNPPAGVHDPLGVVALNRDFDLRQQVLMLLEGASAGLDTGRPDVAEDFLARAELIPQRDRRAICALHLFMLLQSAANRSDREQLDSRLAELDELIIHDERTSDLLYTRAVCRGRCAQIMADHETALREFQHAASLRAGAPLQRSWLARKTAESLEALGRGDEAEQQRQLAVKLAPQAWWNRTPEEIERDDGIKTFAAELRQAVQASKPAQEQAGRPAGSIAPVASSAACAAWLVGIAAMIPLLGLPAAVAQLTLGILLGTKRHPLRYDRRVGRLAVLGGFVALGCSILSWGGCLYSMINRHDQRYSWVAEPVIAQGRAQIAEGSHAIGLELDDSALSDSPEAATNPIAEDESHIEAEEAAASPHLSPMMIAFILVVVIISLVLHEIGHAVAACWSGDPTARDQGRFSLNPLRHLTWTGGLIVPLILTLLPGDMVIGWARPVPVQEHRYRNLRRGRLAVGLSGVSMNLFLALLATNALMLLLMLLKWLNPEAEFPRLGFEDLQPFNYHGRQIWLDVSRALGWVIIINTLLVFFNLIPFPPLDGFHCVKALAPRTLDPLLSKASGLGLIVLLVVLAVGSLTFLVLPGAMAAGALIGLANLCAGNF